MLVGEELLDLLRVLDEALAMEPDSQQMLDRVVSGPCFLASDLPQPTPEQCRAPTVSGEAGNLFGELEVEDTS